MTDMHNPPDEATGLTEALGELSSTVREAETKQDQVESRVVRARIYGASWAQIGEALGVTRQAAWERYRHVA